MVSIKLNLLGTRNQKVSGVLRSFNGISDILLWFNDWFPRMCDLAGNKIYDDSHWKVNEIWEYYSEDDEAKVLILEANDKIQGFMIVVNGYNGIVGKPCVYVPFLSVAPWNRKNKDLNKRELKNIGKILISKAALIAFKKYSSPEIELHSLPSAEGFYRKIGLKETGRQKNDLKEFRLHTQQGFDLLRFLMPYLELRRVK